MTTFVPNDKVYCPGLSTKPFLTYKKTDINGIFICLRGVEYWFTTSGVPQFNPNSEGYPRVSLPALFKGDEITRLSLCDLYDIEYLEDIDIPLYALNITYNGSATEDWVFWSQEGYYDWHKPYAKLEGAPTVDEMQHYEIIVTPQTKRLLKIQENHLKYSTHSKIIVVDKQSINKWCNPI